MNLREIALRMFGRRTEQRNITSLPWDAGGARRTVVTTETALSLVPVFAAVRLLASQIASLPLHTYRRQGNTRKRIDTRPLFLRPAARGTLYDWLHRAVTSLALRGNAYGLITARDADQYPTMVEWLHPDDVWVEDLAPSGPGSYANPIWYWQGRVVPAEDIVHIPWFTIPGRVCGLSPIGACAATIGTGLSAQSYTADWFDNGAVPPGEFRNETQVVTQAEADIIGARLNAAIRKRRPLVYGKDWVYKPISVSAHEAKFVETLKLNATQVASMYGIPPEMIGGEAGGNLHYSTTELNGDAFVKFCLRPWLELLEQAFTALTPRPQYLKFNVDALLRSDLTSRMNSYKTAREIGLNSIDELRALEDEEPLPNGQGQSYAPLQVGRAATEPRGRTAVRKFNPAQPRNPHSGEWIDMPGDGVAKALDKLDLLARIDLWEGESLVASDWVSDPTDDADVVMALLNTADGPRLYLGIVAREDRHRWRAEQFGSTVELDPDATQRARNELAELDGRARRAAAAMEKKVDAYEQEGRPFDFDLDVTVAKGAIPAGSWGDIGYEVELTDDEPIGWKMRLGVLPAGGEGESLAHEAIQSVDFEPAQVRSLIRRLDAMTRLAEQHTSGRSRRQPRRIRSYAAVRATSNGNGHKRTRGTAVVGRTATESRGRTALRKFNINQPRVPGGEHGGEWSATGVLKDVLKLAGKIDLDPDENLLGSNKVDGKSGSIRMALTDRHGHKSLRLGIGGPDFGGRDDEAGPWRGGPDRTAEINAERKRLSDEQDSLQAEWDRLDADPNADPARKAAVEARLDELDDMPMREVLPAGYTAKIDQPSADQLRATLAAGLNKGEAREAELNAGYERLDVLDAQLDAMDAQPDEWWDASRQVQYKALLAERKALAARLDAAPGYQVFAEGVIPGEWADVYYDVYLDDLGVGVQAGLGAVPHGSGRDFSDLAGHEQTATLDPAEVRKLLRLLGRYTDTSATPRSRPFRPDTRVHVASNGNGHKRTRGTAAVLELLDRPPRSRPKGPAGNGRPVLGAAAMVDLLGRRSDPWAPESRHLPGLHDQKTHGRPGVKGAAKKALKKVAKSLDEVSAPEVGGRVPGRDISAHIDYRGLPASYNPKTGENDALKAIIGRQGFDGHPRVVSPDEFDAAVADGNVRETWRGLTSTLTSGKPDVLAEQYRTGDFYVGLGINGDGTYVAMNKGDGEYYGSTLLRIGLHRDARVISADDLDAEMDALFAKNRRKSAALRELDAELLKALARARTPRERANIRRKYRNDVYGLDPNRSIALQRDPGIFAALRGYDAVHISKDRSPDKHEEMIILNRTATIVQR